MADKLDVKIITPERVVFSHPAESVLLPGTVGEMEILPGHVALFSTLKPGQITVRDGSKQAIFSGGTGIVEVCSNRVSLLVDSAVGNSEIDPEEAERLIAEAEDRLKNLSSEDEEQRFAFETQLATARARIEVYERVGNTEDKESMFSQMNLEPVKKDNDSGSSV
jgi:F-type H+-transporting ATPase subunit epsilon